MTWTQAQRDTVNEIRITGFHLNKGEPCECGGENYTTTKEVGYSDFVTYTHTCNDCENVFETYIEG